MDYPSEKKRQNKKPLLGSMKLLLGSAIIMLGASGCESVFDKDQNCDPAYYLQFVYDMNMDYADAFQAKVSSVEVMAFDSESGDLKGRFMESGQTLKQDGYRMKLDLEPGQYDFVVWCGLEENEGQFSVSDNITKKEQAKCTMSRNRNSHGKATQNSQLHSLFHGYLSAGLDEKPGDHVFPVSLIKDTNNINFSLQDVSGKELDPNRFTITMNINNGSIDYNNSLLDDEDIEYSPYYQASGSASVDTKAEETRHDIVVAEISTSRLVEDHNPTLDITDNLTGNIVYSVPLVKWALMLKSEQYSSMGDQEYLDREDEYNVVLYVKENDVVDDSNYLAASIIINGWRIVLNGGTELH